MSSVSLFFVYPNPIGTHGDDNEERTPATEAEHGPAQAAPGGCQKAFGRSHQACRDQAKEGSLEEAPRRCEKRSGTTYYGTSLVVSTI